MKKKNRLSILAFGIGMLALWALSPVIGQEAADYSIILGDWDLEVDAGGEYFYLSFSLEKTEEGLKGSISESSGYFSEVPLQNVGFDGTNLTFEMSIPTPPDGYENMVKTELELSGGMFSGYLSVESLGISAAAKASKKS